jgi:hypothetical protein
MANPVTISIKVQVPSVAFHASPHSVQSPDEIDHIGAASPACGRGRPGAPFVTTFSSNGPLACTTDNFGLSNNLAIDIF